MKKFEINFIKIKKLCRYRFKEEDDKHFWCWNVLLEEKKCNPKNCPILKNIKAIKP